MDFYIRPANRGVVEIFKTLTLKEFELIKNHQYKLFPPRYFNDKYFCGYFDLGKARRIASESANFREGIYQSCIVKFLLPNTFIKKFKVDSSNPLSYICIKKEELESLNSEIIGYIEFSEQIDITRYAT